jgi:hypothetical protein
MKALLRYAVMRGMRENFLLPLLFFPAVMCAAPLLAGSFYAFQQGRFTWPLSIARDISPAASAQVLTSAALLAAAAMAGTGAFWVFRSEMTGRSIGLFALARRPGLVAATSTVFGTVAGVGCFGITVAVIALLTESTALRGGALFAAVALACALASALGTLLVAVSHDLSMLIPVYVINALAGVWLVDYPSIVLSVSVVAATALLSVAAPFFWRRRCA